jgi:hypothetical protein
MGSVAALTDEIQMAEAEALLRDIDRSWWIIREQLDAYLEQAERQASSAFNTIAVLRDYTKCSADFFQLRSAEFRAVQADEAAKRQLHDTWHTLVHEFGLLAARVADSGAFLQFDRLDVASQDFSDNRSAMCGFGTAALTAGFSVVQKSLKDGLAQQTWRQIEGIIVEASMLDSRLLTEGLQVPGKETLTQAFQRIAVSFQEAVAKREDLAVEVAVRTCSSKQSLLEVRQSAFEKDSAVVEASLAAKIEVSLAQQAEMREELKAEREVLKAEMHATEGRMMTVSIVGLMLIGLLIFVVSRTRN